jgi:lysine-N-methylase
MVLEVIVRHLAQRDPRLYRVHECLQDFMQGINHEPAASLESCTRCYVDAYTRYYAPFMEEHPYLLENYVVNHVFRTRFPFGLKSGNDFDDPLHEYVLLCVEFAVIKGLLIGMAGCHRETFSAHHVVKVAHTFARAFEHIMGVREVMHWQGLAGTESMAALLKN